MSAHERRCRDARLVYAHHTAPARRRFLQWERRHGHVVSDEQPAHIRQATGLALMVRRRECGLTQLELANRAHLGQATIARIETGKCALAIEHLWPLAAALDIGRAELLERIEHAGRTLTAPEARAMFVTGRQRVRAPKLRE